MADLEVGPGQFLPFILDYERHTGNVSEELGTIGRALGNSVLATTTAYMLDRPIAWTEGAKGPHRDGAVDSAERIPVITLHYSGPRAETPPERAFWLLDRRDLEGAEHGDMRSLAEGAAANMIDELQNGGVANLRPGDSRIFRGGRAQTTEERLVEKFVREYGKPRRVPQTAAQFVGDLVLMTNTLLAPVTGGKAMPPVWFEGGGRPRTVGEHIARADGPSEA